VLIATTTEEEERIKSMHKKVGLASTLTILKKIPGSFGVHSEDKVTVTKTKWKVQFRGL
jgi:hypothetical protein